MVGYFICNNKVTLVYSALFFLKHSYNYRAKIIICIYYYKPIYRALVNFCMFLVYMLVTFITLISKWHQNLGCTVCRWNIYCTVASSFKKIWLQLSEYNNCINLSCFVFIDLCIHQI